MNRPRTLLSGLTLAAACIVFTVLAPSASAQRRAETQGRFQYQQLTYKVQVEYWFFDTTSYHWSTVYESSDYDYAYLVYQLLKAADEDGNLNAVVPNSYWRYIAVDVRLVSPYQIQQAPGW